MEGLWPMKRILLVAAFTLCLPLAALCQQVRPENIAKAARAIMKMEGKWVRAVLRHDVKTMSRILADDYIGVSSGGEIKDKAQTMKDFKSAALSFSAMDLSDFDLHAEGEMYIVTGRALVKATVGSRDLDGHFRYAKTYVKRRGRWQVLALYITRSTEPR